MSKRATADLVHYCPGSAPGSPAHMARALAQAQLIKDLDYIAIMNQVGALPSPTHYPHINGLCGACRQDVLSHL